MRCEDVERLLDDRRDGRLDEVARRELDEHLDDCDRCRREEALRRRDEAAVLQAVEAFPVAEGFTSSVIAHVREERRWSRRRGLAFVGAGALTAAAAALLLIALGTAPPAFLVESADGGLVRLAGDTGTWTALASGDRVEADSWILTFPERRASVEVSGLRLLMHGDTLLRAGVDRIDLLRGRMLVTFGPSRGRVVTPFGEVTAREAVAALRLRYEREPLFRLGSGGEPERSGSLLLVAGIPVAAKKDSPGGTLEVTVIEGTVEWRSGAARGSLRAGERRRLGVGDDAATTHVENAGGEEWMVRPIEPLASPVIGPGGDAAASFRNGLSSGTSAERRAAADGLSRLPAGPEARRDVIARLAREEDPEVVAALLDCLRRQGPAGADGEIEVVRRRMRDPDPRVRDRALRCWVDRRGTTADVGSMIDDPEPSLRRLALRGLRALGDPAGRTWAEKALEDPDASVVEEARRTLAGLPEG
jgi:anti-sigma factor RsiW